MDPPYPTALSMTRSRCIASKVSAFTQAPGITGTPTLKMLQPKGQRFHDILPQSKI